MNSQSCYVCDNNLVIGQKLIYTNYNLITECCLSDFSVNQEECLYIGFDGMFHGIRMLRSKRCPNCGSWLRRIDIRCGDNGSIEISTNVCVELELLRYS